MVRAIGGAGAEVPFDLRKEARVRTMRQQHAAARGNASADSVAVRRTRGVLAAGFAALVVLCLSGVQLAPRAFWTLVVPLVPIGFVWFGFHAWRRVCPIGAAGALGASAAPRSARVSPAWRLRMFWVPMVVLLIVLTGRLVATNGDGLALGAFLCALPLAAYVVNRRFGGRAFCHYVCPVGVVERIYTDGGAPVRPAASDDNSQCGRCTGCASSCPDIDQPRASKKTRTDSSRRAVVYAFPGVVFGFYLYYLLRGGSWSAYFDGAWTAQPATYETWFGAGFFFAPSVPAVFAAAATLVVCGGVSFLCFLAVESGWRIVGTAPFTRVRATMLALASFVAFNVFYLFAGAPTLRLVPGASEVMWVLAPAVSLVVLGQRLQRLRTAVPTVSRRRLPVLASAFSATSKLSSKGSVLSTSAPVATQSRSMGVV